MITIDISGPDGNAFHILATVRTYLREECRIGEWDEWREKATSGDYEHLLGCVRDYFPGQIEIVG